MTAVSLNRRLALEAPTRVPDAAGGYAETWVELGVLWADIRARSGREAAGEAVSLSKTGYRILVRATQYDAPSRPQAGQRFRDGNRIFQIRSVAEYDAKVRYLTCFCEEEVAV